MLSQAMGYIETSETGPVKIYALPALHRGEITSPDNSHIAVMSNIFACSNHYIKARLKKKRIDIWPENEY